MGLRDFFFGGGDDDGDDFESFVADYEERFGVSADEIQADSHFEDGSPMSMRDLMMGGFVPDGMQDHDYVELDYDDVDDDDLDDSDREYDDGESFHEMLEHFGEFD